MTLSCISADISVTKDLSICDSMWNMYVYSNLISCIYSSFNLQVKCLFVCLFVFLSHSKIFHSYGDVSITVEGLKILIYAWPLSSEGSLVCHTYYDMGHPFKMVISEDL